MIKTKTSWSCDVMWFLTFDNNIGCDFQKRDKGQHLAQHQPEWDNGRKPAGHHHRRLCPRCAHPRSRGDGGRCHRARGRGRVLQVWARRCHRWSFLILSKSSVWSPLALWLAIAGVHWAQVQVWPKKTLKVAQQTKPKESVSSAFFLLLYFLLLVVLLLVEEGGLLLDRLLPGPPLRLAGALPPWHQAAHHSRAGQSIEFKTGIELKSRPGVGIFSSYAVQDISIHIHIQRTHLVNNKHCSAMIKHREEEKYNHGNAV